MHFKIIIDDELEVMTGKVSRKTFNEMFPVAKPVLESGSFFRLANGSVNGILINVDQSIIQDENILYLHQSAKDSCYPDNETIHIGD
jgi:hypothetical protein